MSLAARMIAHSGAEKNFFSEWGRIRGMTPEFKTRLCGNDKSFFPPGRAPVVCGNGAVAASHPVASFVGVDVIRQGGSAADAAVAAAAILCVAEPHMTGIGGDAFALVRECETGGEPVALDGSGWLPEKFCASGVVSETSPHSVTVPGAVAAWEKLHQRFGKLPWANLLAPAVRAAHDGIPVAPRVARDWRNEKSRVVSDGDARALFLPNGRAPSAGETHRNPALARALSDIARNGARTFYAGDIARDIVRKLNAAGGAHSESDFADYYEGGAEWREPAAAAYREWKVWECPPAGQGLAALLMLRAMEGRDLGNESAEDRAVAFAEICRRAYQWRDANIGDGAPVGEADDILESALRENFSATGAEHRDTVYLAAVDGGGLCVSFINSLFHPFGSGIVAPQSGILLHNRGAAFSPEMKSPNAAGPRRRPMHTLAPAMAQSPRGDALVFGVMGGQYQAAGHAWFLTNVLDLQCDLQSALDAPRLFAFPPESPGLRIEPGFSESVRRALTGAGWRLADLTEPLGGGQAVLRFADGVLLAASDARKDGCAAGF